MVVLQLYAFLAFFLGLQKCSYISAKSHSESQNFAKTKSVYCAYNPEFMKNFTCSLKPINWDLTLLDADGDFIKPMWNPTLRLQAFKYTNQFRPFLLNYTVDWCQVMNKKFVDLYIQTAYKIVANQTNLIHKCPPMGHWEARKAYLDLTVVPFTVPKGQYKIVAAFYDGRPYKFVVSVEVIIKVQKGVAAKRKTKQTENP